MTKLTRRSVLVGGVVLAAAAFGVSAMLVRGDAVASIEPNGAAPAFSVQDAQGRTRTLSEFRGRVVVLEWTNHGCPYVQRHYRPGAMQALQQEVTAAGIVWLQVISSAPGEQGYLDGAGALAQVQSDNARPTATLLDPTGVMGRAYAARNTPQMFVIDAQGRVVYQGAIDDRPTARAAAAEGATNYLRAALADIAAGRPVQIAQTTPYGCTVKYAT